MMRQTYQIIQYSKHRRSYQHCTLKNRVENKIKLNGEVFSIAHTPHLAVSSVNIIIFPPSPTDFPFFLGDKHFRIGDTHPGSSVSSIIIPPSNHSHPPTKSAGDHSHKTDFSERNPTRNFICDIFKIFLKSNLWVWNTRYDFGSACTINS